MTDPGDSVFQDIHYLPPADLAAPELREYEKVIAEKLAEFGAEYQISAVEVEGHRPDTTIVIKTSDGRVIHFPLWASEYPTSGNEEYGFLAAAPDVALRILGDWLAGDLT